MSPTPNEQKALTFLAAMLLLGGAVRILRAGPPPAPPTPMEQQALARQATAADSAAASQQASKSGKRSRKARVRTARSGEPTVVAGVASVPFSDVRPDRPDRRASDGWFSRQGYPPPGPRIDSWSGGSPPAPGAASSPYNRRSSTYPAPGSPASTPGTVRAPAPPAGPALDLDSATEQQVETLPRIGPALARRIVANRDTFGAFGSLESLRRVRGVGTATLARLAPLVSFSGRTPPSR